MLFNTLFIGFTSAGLPLSVTFSFLISSPLVDLASVILLANILNWTIALSYVIVGLTLAALGGTVIRCLRLAGQVEPFVFQSLVSDHDNDGQISRGERLAYARDQVSDTVHRIWLYVLIGVGIGASIHNWIPGVLLLPHWVRTDGGRYSLRRLMASRCMRTSSAHCRSPKRLFKRASVSAQHSRS